MKAHLMYNYAEYIKTYLCDGNTDTRQPLYEKCNVWYKETPKYDLETGRES